MKIHAPSLLLCTVMVLQGCISTMVVSTVAIATKIAVDPRTIGTQIDDGTLKARVTNALAKDQKLNKNVRINNTVYYGRVLLTGQALTIDLAERAKQIAMNIDGVTDVYNEIRQGYPISFWRMSLDIWITIKIYSEMLVNNAIKSFNIKVTTENGEVFLLGLVTHSEGKIAAELVSKINGVKHVITAFIYLQ